MAVDRPFNHVNRERKGNQGQEKRDSIIDRRRESHRVVERKDDKRDAGKKGEAAILENPQYEQVQESSPCHATKITSVSR